MSDDAEPGVEAGPPRGEGTPGADAGVLAKPKEAAPGEWSRGDECAVSDEGGALMLEDKPGRESAAAAPKGDKPATTPDETRW